MTSAQESTEASIECSASRPLARTLALPRAQERAPMPALALWKSASIRRTNRGNTEPFLLRRRRSASSPGQPSGTRRVTEGPPGVKAPPRSSRPEGTRAGDGPASLQDAGDWMCACSGDCASCALSASEGSHPATRGAPSAQQSDCAVTNSTANILPGGIGLIAISIPPFQGFNIWGLLTQGCAALALG